LSVWANENNLPHVYPVNQIGLLAGDLTALVDATYSQSVQLQNLGILFASQLSPSDIVSISKLPNVRIIIQQNHFLDLVLASVPSNYELSPITYTNESSPYNGWAPMFWGWHNWYYQAPLERLVFTEVPSALAMPYTALQTGNYHLSMKLYFGPQASNVKVFLDDEQISDINTKTSEELGFNWVSINSILLQQGTHQLKIQSAQGENVVARVNLAPENVITDALGSTAALMKDREVDIISKLRLQNSTEYTLAISPSDVFQAIQNATLTRRHPSGEPYSVDVGNNSLLLNVYFSHNASISESLSTELPLQTNVDLTIYQNFEIAIKLGDSQKTNLYPLLLVDVGNSTHAWFRLVPISARAQSSITLRDDGIYDIWCPIVPSTDAQGYSVFKVNLLEALRNFFPGEQSFNITGIRYNFAKSAGVSLADKNAGNFNLSIKDQEFFGSPWYTTQIGVNASEGFAVSSFSSMPTSFSVYVPKSTAYNILLRGTSGTSPCSVTAKINSSKFNFILNPENSSDWHDIGQVDLDQGNITIIFQSDATDRINLDQLNLVESPNSPDSEYKIDNFTCQNINPSKYLLTCQSNQPFFVMFSESYSSLWKIALPDGSKISSYPAFSFGNLYFVNRTGDFQAILECEAQGLQVVMMDLAFGLFAFLILCLVAPTLFQRIPQIKAIFTKKTSRPHL
jgi:hypothetical protein